MKTNEKSLFNMVTYSIGCRVIANYLGQGFKDMNDCMKFCKDVARQYLESTCCQENDKLNKDNIEKFVDSVILKK